MSHRKKYHSSGKKFLHIICLSALFFVPDFKAAADVVNDPESVGWVSRSNMTSSDFTDEFNDQSENGYILVDIEVNQIEGQQRVSGIWQRNLDGRSWEAHRNLTYEEFGEKWDDFDDRGYRLIDQESYVLGGNRYYAGIWIDNVERYKWKSWRNLTRAEYQDKVNELESTHMLIDFEAYTSGGSTRYACVWVEEKKGLQWKASSGLTETELKDNIEINEKDYRVHDIESYKIGGNQRYAVIWIKNTNGRKYKMRKDRTLKEYRNLFYRFRDEGYRLTDFEQYETSSGIRYAGVWRQNNDRPDWPLRETIDEISQNFIESWSTNGHLIDGMGVAIIHKGKILYKRGFGDQDNDGTWYSAQTINRLASVSKAVGGVLLYKLDELGLIDPTARTSSYVPDLPSDIHKHTLEDLASCRSQVGHYEIGLGSHSKQYNTALSACDLFWGIALTPDNQTDSWGRGDRTPPYYHYSTHGYTLLGAAMEGATGKSISELVDHYMGSEIDLPTLRVEDRRDADYFRSEVFTNNNVVSADNSSWKVLGGGLEASVEEMAIFCGKLMGGEILSSANLQTMWASPDNSWSYAMGWNSLRTRNSQNVDSVMKGGRWSPGADTHLRLFPDLEMGVVVLCNTSRNPSPANRGLADDLTLSISNQVLGILAPVLSVEPLSETIDFGGSTLLSVSAVSNNAVSYQWRKDGVNIPGATSRTLSLSAESRADIGNYSVVVSNSAGSVVSSNASIYVLTPQIVEPLGMTDRKGFRLRFGDKDGYPLKKSDKDHFRVEWSNDLKKWSAIPASSYSVIGGKIVANDLTASGVDYRYYRVRQF
ncbi:serine hydrolase [Verrucomicrobiales bacterium]|nr:serine hydrolase [Verrucomicrobiales bacterium]